MKLNSTLLVLLSAMLLSCQPKSVAPLQKEVDEITKQWLPDTRVGICKISLIPGNAEEIIVKGESSIPGAKAEVLQLLHKKGLTIIDSVTILPDTTTIEKNWGLVTLSVVNLRSKPANSSELVSQGIMGTPVRILKEDNGWYLIQTPDRYISWTGESSLQPMNRAEITAWKNADRLLFTETYGTVFEDKNLTKVMSDLVAGCIVVKKGTDKLVTEVGLPDGRTGYIQGASLADFKQWKEAAALNSDKMILTGERFLGFPYLWGGTSSKAMDCSGFVKTVCFLNGMILERDASQQARHGVEIDVASGWQNLQKGDLLFFGSKQPYKVVHVGMYMGDSELINSSGSVRICSLDSTKTDYSKHLASTLVGARRIIGLTPEQGFIPVKMHNWY